MNRTDIRYSEIFRSFQGEGAYTGVPCVWLRYFMCNLQCNGFGQKDPTDPKSYVLPYQTFDVSSVNKMEDLPVWQYGCDSSYSWSKRFQHLTHTGTPREVAEALMEALQSASNPDGKFMHPESLQDYHLCLTGGEPMLPKHQLDTVNILNSLENDLDNMPLNVTVETNGTQLLKKEFIDYFDDRYLSQPAPRLFFSVSPKLFTVSGEKNSKAIKPEVVADYYDFSEGHGQLKFVIGTDDAQWSELDRVVNEFRNAGALYDVHIMPVGAREEEQHNVAAIVSDRAMDNGYRVAARVHTYVYGNVIGT